MEKLEIEIPDGKKPKMTEEENRCIIEWVKAEKTFEDYVKEFAEQMEDDFAIRLDTTLSCYWKSMFKFGLLQFIADDLNEEKLDWGNSDQTKHELVYSHSDDKIENYLWWESQHAGAIFTEAAAEKALKIIPIEFLKTL